MIMSYDIILRGVYIGRVHIIDSHRHEIATNQKSVKTDTMCGVMLYIGGLPLPYMGYIPIFDGCLVFDG